MLPPFQLEHAINQIVREEWGRILAALVTTVGDFQLAEDSLQDAVEVALTSWKKGGLPDVPAAWLIRAARNKAIDRMRRDIQFATLQPQISYQLDLESHGFVEDADTIPDKRLELIFTCCHPALDQKTRVALTLRALGGLTTEEIAHCFLDQTNTMAQRLARAKKKIAAANIPYEVPEAIHLNERVGSVLSVIYLIFNEGYSASTGQEITKNHLVDEAIRLARITQQLMPEQTEAAGLLALLLLHDSRRKARRGSFEEIIALQHQDRTLWNRAQIGEGVALLNQTLLKRRTGVYQVQAAISALHAEASSWEDTDWQQITALYQFLYTLQPTPVITINHAVALSYAHSPDAALSLLEKNMPNKIIERYQPYHAAKADILIRAGKTAVGIEHLKKAIQLTDNAAEKLFLEHRLEQTGNFN